MANLSRKLKRQHIINYDTFGRAAEMDKNELILLCVGGDFRHGYMSSALAEHSDVYTLGVCPTGGNAVSLDCIEDMDCKADMLVLPMMKSKSRCESLDIPLPQGGEVSCHKLSGVLKKGALVTGGMLSVAQIEYFSALGFEVADYFKREELVIKNCIPTAEGALQIAMNETGITIFGSKVLIIGYGRVAKACANLFKGAGAYCTVAARKSSALAEAENAGLSAVKINDLADRVSYYDIIINTVPAMVIDESVLRNISKDGLIIDLASKPGGVDFTCAKELNRRVVHALSLPGKCAPITAGKIIAETVMDIFHERGK